MATDPEIFLIDRLRKATGAGFLLCKNYLSSLGEPDKEKIVMEFEQGKRHFGPPPEVRKPSAGNSSESD